MTIQLLLLGSFKLHNPNTPQSNQPNLERKTRALLAYLARHEKPLLRQTLWTLFFQQANDPAGALRWHLSRIRRLVHPEAIVDEDGMLALNTAVFQIDHTLFHQTFSQPESQTTDQLQSAFDLYGAPFLTDMTLANCPEFELWLLAERTAAQQLYEKGGLALIRQLIDGRRYQSAIPIAQQLLQSNPLLEAAHDRLIWLYAKTEQRQSALEQYAYCERLLREELAVEPSESLRLLHNAIVNQQPLPPVVASAQAAISPSNRSEPIFVGRNDTLNSLRQSWHSLNPGQSGIVLIEAEAGGGKTALASQFLSQIDRPILRSSCYATTQALPYHPWLPILEGRLRQMPNTQTPLPAVWQRQLAHLLHHLFDQPSSGAEEQTHLFRAIAFLLREVNPAPSVIFLDDLQWADSASLALLFYLGLTAPSGREPLLLLGSVRNEELADNPTLTQYLRREGQNPALRRLPLAPLTVLEVEQLLLAKRPSLSTPTLPTQLQKETGGNPLFVTELLNELTRSPDTLPDPLPVPPSLQALTTERLARLTAVSRQLLEAVAVVGQPVHFDVARQISGRSEEEVVQGIEQGLRYHLLHPLPKGRYEIQHGLLQQAILAQLPPIRRQRLHKRTAVTLTRRRTNAATLLYHWERAGFEEKTAHYAYLAGDAALKKAAFQEAIHFFETGMHNLPDDALEKRFDALEGMVRALDATSQMDALEERLGQLQQVAERLEMPLYLAKTAVYQARFAQQRSESAQAQAIAEAGLPLTEAANAPKVRTDLMVAIAFAQAQQGDYQTAKTHIQEAIDQYRLLNDRRGQVKALNQLGVMSLRLGQHQEAVEQFRQTIAMCQKLGDTFLESQALASLGNGLWSLGLYDELAQMAERGLKVAQQIGDRNSETRHFNSLAGVALHNLEYEKAIDHYKKGLAISEEIQSASGVSVYNNNIAGAYVGLQKIGDALRHAETAVLTAQKANLPYLEALAHYTTGHAHRADHNLLEARQAFEKALAIRQRLGQEVAIMFTQINLLQTCLELDDLDGAHPHFEYLEATFPTLKAEVPAYAHQMHYFALYLYHDACGQSAKAREALQYGYDALQERLNSLDEASKQRTLADDNTQALLKAYAASSL